jgi:hypothetical protein
MVTQMGQEWFHLFLAFGARLMLCRDRYTRPSEMRSYEANPITVLSTNE